MTARTPLPQNAASLRDYLDEMQRRARRLEGLIKVIAHIENDADCADGKAALIYFAEHLSADLTDALDVVNLPEH